MMQRLFPISIIAIAIVWVLAGRVVGAGYYQGYHGAVHVDVASARRK